MKQDNDAVNVTNDNISIANDGSYEVGGFYHVQVNSLHRDIDQPRKHFGKEEIDKLTTSIMKHGVLQPVIFRLGEDGCLLLVSGERRHRAAVGAGLETIPAIFSDGSNAPEIALVENLLREDLTPLEEAEGLAKLKKEKNYTHEQLSEVIGKKVSTVSEILKLDKLPDAIKDKIRDNPVHPRRTLLEVAKGETDQEKFERFKMIEEGNLTSDETRAKTRKPKHDNPLAVVWENKIEKFRKGLEKLSAEDLTEGKEGVLDSLGRLADQIQQKVKACQ